jgi:hypothetical protein
VHARPAIVFRRIDHGGAHRIKFRSIRGQRHYRVDTANWVRADVPPVLSSTAVWSPIPQPKEIGREEALFRRTDHRLPA